MRTTHEGIERNMTDSVKCDLQLETIVKKGGTTRA